MSKKLKKIQKKLSALARIVKMQEVMIDEKVLDENEVFEFIDSQMSKLSTELKTIKIEKETICQQ